VLSGGEEANHPDLFVLDPLRDGEEQIKVARIARRSQAGEEESGERCLEVFLALRAFEGGYRPVLIRESQRLNAAAQNALLKTLEEPRPRTVIVLETHESALLLSTLKSRCVRLRLRSPDLETCRAILEQQGLEPAEARALARLARGSPGLALAARGRNLLALRALLMGLLAGQRAALATAAELWELEGDFPGGTENARDRERLRSVLELSLELLLDCLRARAGRPPAGLAHGELVPEILGRLDERGLESRVGALLEARADVERNLNPAMLLERSLLVLEEGVPILSGLR
jgi:DNA polymerase-3 subunit delta'